MFACLTLMEVAAKFCTDAARLCDGVPHGRALHLDGAHCIRPFAATRSCSSLASGNPQIASFLPVPLLRRVERSECLSPATSIVLGSLG